ncbi:MAG TPA: ISNCY family transposase [Dissulfurispiraceae bacterium]|nr:ISNCY family transposase [Dissulfurispiraceae bacterium]
MAGKDIVMLRQRDLKRLHVVHKVLEGILTQAEAANMVGLSERQIRRIVSRIREEGDGGIQHRSRGRASNRKLPQKLKDRIIELYRQKYQGFGPLLATEKLCELDGITVSDETLRRWLIEAGEWKVRLKRKAHREWRPGKEHCGEMLQMEGSHHDWFEGRGPACVLMGYIDDATGRVYGRFYAYEGTIPAMDSFKRYIRKYGIPLSVYLDKHTTYKSPATPTSEEEIEGKEPVSEFGGALRELGVQLIHAHSPQAKGRVERLFKTLQDRLIREMRLRGIGSIEEANRFLAEYLPIYNRRFARKAVKQEDLHRRVVRGLDLDAVLCIRTERTLRNDFTIAHDRKLYQIQETVKGAKVIVEERINGSMFITSQGKRVKFREITERPDNPSKPRRRRRQTPVVPAADHPWRKLFQKERLKKTAA